MAGDTNRSALSDAEPFAEPRQIEGRLLVGAGLALFGGVLWALFLMGDDLQRGVGSINNAYDLASRPATCGPEDLPTDPQAVAAAIGPQPSVAAEPARAESRPQPAEAVARAGGAGTTARSTSFVARGSKSAPTYIRRPTPEPEPAPPALEALRRSL